jgi:hypothetical protein
VNVVLVNISTIRGLRDVWLACLRSDLLHWIATGEAGLVGEDTRGLGI